MSQADLIIYYSDLLTPQFLGGPKNAPMIQALVAPVIMPQTSVQSITFPLIPTSGTFVLLWNGYETAPINWDDSAAVVQAKIRDMSLVVDGGDAATTSWADEADGGDAATLAWDLVLDGGTAAGFGSIGLDDVTVTGAISDGLLIVTFVDVPAPVSILVLGPDSLLSSSTPVVPVIAEDSTTLPLAVQGGYNLIAGT